MAEESENQDETNKGKDKELNQDDEGTQDETESAADSETEDEEDDEDDEDDDEPKLKYARLTGQLGPVYRNGDAMSAFLVAGDKMVGLGYLVFHDTC
jgi:hypothetical protein